MNPGEHAARNGLAVTVGEGPALWFPNTLTINKAGPPT